MGAVLCPTQTPLILQQSVGAKDSDNCQHAGTEVRGDNFMQITNFNLQPKPMAKNNEQGG